MDLSLIIRFLHIASAIVFIGGTFARQVVRSLARQTDNVHKFAALSEGAGRIESLMVIPGNLAVILFGVILALMTGAPILGFLQGASRNWLLVTNLLLVLGFLAVPLVFIPRGKKFALVLQDALAKGEMTPPLRMALEDKTIRFMHLVEMVSLVVIVVLMVFKPF